MKKFIEWVGSDYTPCVLLYNDDGEKDHWIIYKDKTADIELEFNTTDELFEHWFKNINIVSSY